MQALTNSAFLQALGYAIANSLWQMALLWIVFLLFTNFIKLTAANKYRLAVAAQLLGFAWFTVTLQFYYMQCSNALKISNEFVGHQHFNLVVPGAGNTLQSNLVSIMLKGEQLLPYLSAAYLLLLVFLVVKWTRCYKHAQSIRTAGLHKINVDWKLFVKNIAGHMGIKQEVKIYLSELVKTPVTVGFFKPIILVPLASINQLSTQQMEAVLLHELAHIKRFDYLLNLLLSVVETMLFFNPFTQLLSKSIKKERENSCDDWVLQFQYSPSMYAEALLRIAYMQSTPAFAMAFAGKNKNDLLSRVKRMIDSNEPRSNYRNQLLALLLMTGILSSIAWFQPINKNASTSNVKSLDILKAKKTLVKEPMLANVSNPLFNPVFFLQKPIKQEIEKTIENVKLGMIEAEVQEDEAAAESELATIAPIAAKNLEDVDWDNAEKDVQENMKKFEAKQATHLQVQPSASAHSNMVYDSIAYSYNYNYGFNTDEFKAGWKQMTEEMKKMGIEIEKAIKAKDAIRVRELQKQQAVVNQALAKIKWNSQPFIVNGFATMSPASSTKREISVVEAEKSRAEQARARTLQLQQASTRGRLFVAKKDAESKLANLKSKQDEATASYACTPIPEVVPYNMFTTCASTYQPEEEINVIAKKKSAASRVSITTSVSGSKNRTTTSAVTRSSSNKRYEIVVTGKDGVEKKITVVVED